MISGVGTSFAPVIQHRDGTNPREPVSFGTLVTIRRIVVTYDLGK